MDKSPSVEYIGEIDSSTTVTPQKLVSLLDFAQGSIKVYAKNQAIISKGKEDNNLYQVISGKVKIMTKESNGKKTIFNILQQGQLFGEEMLIGVMIKEYDAIAMTETKVNVLSLNELLEGIFSDKHAAFNFVQKIIYKTYKIQHLWNSKIQDLAKPRIIRFLIQYAEENGIKIGYETVVHKFFTHQELAVLTGSARQTVSTVLHELQEKNIIYFDKKKILYRNVELLENELLNAQK